MQDRMPADKLCSSVEKKGKKSQNKMRTITNQPTKQLLIKDVRNANLISAMRKNVTSSREKLITNTVFPSSFLLKAWACCPAILFGITSRGQEKTSI